MHKRVNIAVEHAKLRARIGEMPRFLRRPRPADATRCARLLAARHALTACDGVSPQKIS